nr:uncharacterized serine-rich protein C215.13-like [Oncorhynchus nerka]
MAKVDGSFLLFEMLNKSDNGVYLCQADNGIGKMQGEYTLLVQDLTDDSNNLFPTSFYLPSSSPTSDSPSSSLSPDSFPTLMSTTSGSGSSASGSLPATIFSFSVPYPSDLTFPPSSSSSSSLSTSSLSPSPPPVNVLSTSLSNSLFPDLSMSPERHPPSSDSFSPSSSSSFSSPPASVTPPSVAPPSSDSLTPSSVTIRLNGVYSFTGKLSVYAHTQLYPHEQTHSDPNYIIHTIQQKLLTKATYILRVGSSGN